MPTVINPKITLMINVNPRNTKLVPACFHFLYLNLTRGKLFSSAKVNSRQAITHSNFCQAGINSKKSKNESIMNWGNDLSHLEFTIYSVFSRIALNSDPSFHLGQVC